MPAKNLPFSQSEYDARITRTRAEMAARNLDTIIVSDPSNMGWLTGYDGWSFYVHQCVILPMQGNPVCFVRAQDANGGVRTVWMPDEDVHGYDENLVQNLPLHPMQELVSVLEERGIAAGAIGVEMDNYWYSAQAHAELVKGLPGANLQDCTGLVNWQRAIKSETEIQYMKIAGQIVTRMHQNILATIEPGMRKNEMVAEILRSGCIGVEGHGGDYPAIVPLLPSGADASAPHLTWDDQPFKSGEATFFEIAGAYKRYQCPTSRTIFLGTPPKKFLEVEEAVVEGINAGLELAKPGNQCQEIAEAFCTILERRTGIKKESRCGYSIGISYPPDWGERTMSLRPGDETVLQPGMTFHFIPAVWQDDWGMEITESFVITEQGAETLSNVPRELFVR
jgi:ectoine hydrolase